MRKIVGLLRLTRPANVITAISDILAGSAIAGFFTNGFVQQWQPLILLILATSGLYGGGVVLNDVFDAELDKVERPERPIPAGVVSKTEAALWGVILLLLGITAAALVHDEFLSLSTFLAVSIAVSAVIYDKWCKHHFIAGPLVMGFCRGLNLLLGISIIPTVFPQYSILAWVPVIYIAAITTISHGEVHGGRKTAMFFSAFLYVTVFTSIMAVAFFNRAFMTSLPFIATFALMVLPPLWKAIQNPVGPVIGAAVKAGVIGLILMNAAWAAAFGLPIFACVTVLLLPISKYLAKAFAVT